MAVAAEHPLAQRAAVQNADVAAFVAECQRGGVSALELETQEKKGVATGLYALHPISGERVPIWVANFVLMGYGTGAVMRSEARRVGKEWGRTGSISGAAVE